MKTLEYIDNQAHKPTRELMFYLHELILSFPGIRATFKYGIPFYERHKSVCYISPLKKGGVELVFTRGYALSNQQGILDFRGRKQVAGILLFSISDVPEAAILEILQDALIVDDNRIKIAKNISN